MRDAGLRALFAAALLSPWLLAAAALGIGLTGGIALSLHARVWQAQQAAADALRWRGHTLSEVTPRQPNASERLKDERPRIADDLLRSWLSQRRAAAYLLDTPVMVSDATRAQAMHAALVLTPTGLDAGQCAVVMATAPWLAAQQGRTRVWINDDWACDLVGWPASLDVLQPVLAASRKPHLLMGMDQAQLWLGPDWQYGVERAYVGGNPAMQTSGCCQARPIWRDKQPAQAGLGPRLATALVALFALAAALVVWGQRGVLRLEFGLRRLAGQSAGRAAWALWLGQRLLLWPALGLGLVVAAGVLVLLRAPLASLGGFRLASYGLGGAALAWFAAAIVCGALAGVAARRDVHLLIKESDS